jgi:hypothetical protein
VAVELRRIFVDQARVRVALKRDGSQRRIPMSDDLSWVDVGGQDMLDLDRALTDLEKLDADKVRLVELRYLMGCTVPEICELPTRRFRRDCGKTFAVCAHLAIRPASFWHDVKLGVKPRVAPA